MESPRGHFNREQASKPTKSENALALLQQCNLLSALDFGGNQLVAALRPDFFQQPMGTFL